MILQLPVSLDNGSHCCIMHVALSRCIGLFLLYFAFRRQVKKMTKYTWWSKKKRLDTGESRFHLLSSPAGWVPCYFYFVFSGSHLTHLAEWWTDSAVGQEAARLYAPVLFHSPHGASPTELMNSKEATEGRREEWSWGVKVVNGWRGENYWYKVGYENRGYGSMQVKKRKEGRWRVSTMVMLKEERLLVRNKVLNKCRKDRGTF